MAHPDLFRCESILLRSHWVLVVIDVFTRRLIGFGVEGGSIDGIAVCRMFNRAIAKHPMPKRISTDHDPLFRFHRWLANLRVREIEEIKLVPYAPVSHPFVERLIGTIRRELLDRAFFWNTTDLARRLDEFNAFIVRSIALRRNDTPETRHRFPRRWQAIGGKPIVAGCFTPRCTRECEFAPHRENTGKVTSATRESPRLCSMAKGCAAGQPSSMGRAERQ
jgi:hypothetical protein